MEIVLDVVCSEGKRGACEKTQRCGSLTGCSGASRTRPRRVTSGATLLGAMLASCLLAPPDRPTRTAAPPVADLSTAGLLRREREGMIFISRRACTVGSSREERLRLAKQFGCNPTWLNDDMEKRTVELPAFWIDRSPVTNAQYLAFV